jgi:uncharacterized protein YegL
MKENNMSKSRPKTHVAVVLDRSGSMKSIAAQALQNYNEQIQQMKENAKDQDIFCSLVTFNGNVFEHLWDQPADTLEEADAESYQPDGGTAMRDAVGYTVKKLLDTTTPDENTAYLIVVISDGYENQSQHYSAADLRSLVNHCQGTKKWTFTYMGCSESYLNQVAQETGIPISNMAAWSNRTEESSSFAFGEARNRNSRYYGSRAKGIVAADSYYSDNVMCCANFDPDAKGVDLSGSIPAEITLAGQANIPASISVGSLPSSIPAVLPSAPAVEGWNGNVDLTSIKGYQTIPVRQEPFGKLANEVRKTIQKNENTSRRSKNAFAGQSVSWKS